MSNDLCEYSGSHVLWCTNHDAEFTSHTDTEPYCEHLVGSVRLILEGDSVGKAQMWVLPTKAYTNGMFTQTEYDRREATYNGVELCIDIWRPEGAGSEQKIRIASSEARTLAAMLIRSADIEQGLTR